LTELGNRLKEARLANGLSLEDLQAITKIQKRYLIGIENGDFSAMPGSFYVRAFIKQYAEAVQLDHDEIFETYKAEIPVAYHEHLPEQLSRVKTHKTLTDRNPKIFDVLPKILIGIFIIGAAALIYYYFLTHNAGNNSKESINNQNATANLAKSDNFKSVKASEKKKKKTNVKKVDSNENSTQTEVPTQEIALVQKGGSRSTYELKNTDKFVVKLVSNGQTWVNIKNGKGYSFFQGMLNKDGTNTQTIDLTKESDAVLVIGRTIDTDIFVNDQKLEYATPPTQVVRQDITIHFVPKNK
jgi:cytoskeletal protein RodZ